MVTVLHKTDQVGVHRLRVSEYLVLTALDSWPRTELLRGVIYDVPSESTTHADAVFDILQALLAAFPGRRVRCTGSMQAGEYSMPEPDVYVERQPDERPFYAQAGDMDLAVEVSVTTLAHDRGPKLAVYAEAGIPEYWIVVPQGSKAYLLRHTEPAGTTYRRVVRIDLPDGIEGLDVEAVRSVR